MLGNACNMHAPAAMHCVCISKKKISCVKTNSLCLKYNTAWNFTCDANHNSSYRDALAILLEYKDNQALPFSARQVHFLPPASMVLSFALLCRILAVPILFQLLKTQVAFRLETQPTKTSGSAVYIAHGYTLSTIRVAVTPVLHFQPQAQRQ